MGSPWQINTLLGRQNKDINVDWNADFATQLYGRKQPKQKLQFLGDTTAIEGQDLLKKGGTLFGQGVETLGQPLAYYKGILGSRQEAQTAMAPEAKTIEQQAQTAAKAVSDFVGRGGGKVGMLSELPFATSARFQGLMEKVRPEAARGVTEIGSLLASLGLQEESLGVNLEQLAGSWFAGLAGLKLSEQQRNDAIAGKAGEAAGALLLALLGGAG